MSREDEWRILGRVGDVDPITHGGGVVFQDVRPTGYPYPPPVLEFTPGLEGVDEDDALELRVYRVDLRSSAEAFLDGFDWVDWPAVAQFAGWEDWDGEDGHLPPPDLLDGSLARAAAVVDLAGYYSWKTLDWYPFLVLVPSLEERWRLD